MKDILGVDNLSEDWEKFIQSLTFAQKRKLLTIPYNENRNTRMPISLLQFMQNEELDISDNPTADYKEFREIKHNDKIRSLDNPRLTMTVEKTTGNPQQMSVIEAIINGIDSMDVGPKTGVKGLGAKLLLSHLEKNADSVFVISKTKDGDINKIITKKGSDGEYYQSLQSKDKIEDEILDSGTSIVVDHKTTPFSEEEIEEYEQSIFKGFTRSGGKIIVNGKTVNEKYIEGNGKDLPEMKVTIEKDKIVIEDNGSGMNVSTLQYLFTKRNSSKSREENKEYPTKVTQIDCAKGEHPQLIISKNGRVAKKLPAPKDTLFDKDLSKKHLILDIPNLEVPDNWEELDWMTIINTNIIPVIKDVWEGNKEIGDKINTTNLLVGFLRQETKDKGNKKAQTRLLSQTKQALHAFKTYFQEEIVPEHLSDWLLFPNTEDYRFVDLQKLAGGKKTPKKDNFARLDPELFNFDIAKHGTRLGGKWEGLSSLTESIWGKKVAKLREKESKEIQKRRNNTYLLPMSYDENILMEERSIAKTTEDGQTYLNPEILEQCHNITVKTNNAVSEKPTLDPSHKQEYTRMQKGLEECMNISIDPTIDTRYNDRTNVVKWLGRNELSLKSSLPSNDEKKFFISDNGISVIQGGKETKLNLELPEDLDLKKIKDSKKIGNTILINSSPYCLIIEDNNKCTLVKGTIYRKTILGTYQNRGIYLKIADDGNVTSDTLDFEPIYFYNNYGNIYRETEESVIICDDNNKEIEKFSKDKYDISNRNIEFYDAFEVYDKNLKKYFHYINVGENWYKRKGKCLSLNLDKDGRFLYKENQVPILTSDGGNFLSKESRLGINVIENSYNTTYQECQQEIKGYELHKNRFYSSQIISNIYDKMKEELPELDEENDSGEKTKLREFFGQILYHVTDDEDFLAMLESSPNLIKDIYNFVDTTPNQDEQKIYWYALRRTFWKGNFDKNFNKSLQAANITRKFSAMRKSSYREAIVNALSQSFGEKKEPVYKFFPDRLEEIEGKHFAWGYLDVLSKEEEVTDIEKEIKNKQANSIFPGGKIVSAETLYKLAETTGRKSDELILKYIQDEENNIDKDKNNTKWKLKVRENIHGQTIESGVGTREVLSNMADASKLQYKKGKFYEKIQNLLDTKNLDKNILQKYIDEEDLIKYIFLSNPRDSRSEFQVIVNKLSDYFNKKTPKEDFSEYISGKLELYKENPAKHTITAKVQKDDDGKKHLVETYKDHGCGISNIVNLLVAEIGEKKAGEIEGGQFNSGFLTFLATGDVVDVKTSDGEGVTKYLSLKMKKDETGKNISFDIISYQKVNEVSLGTSICKKTKLSDNDDSSVVIAHHQAEFLRHANSWTPKVGKEGNKIPLTYNNREIESNVQDERRYYIDVNGESRWVNIGKGDYPQFLHGDGMRMRDLDAKTHEGTPDHLREYAINLNKVVTIDGQIEPLKDRSRPADKDNVMPLIHQINDMDTMMRAVEGLVNGKEKFYGRPEDYMREPDISKMYKEFLNKNIDIDKLKQAAKERNNSNSKSRKLPSQEVWNIIKANNTAQVIFMTLLDVEVTDKSSEDDDDNQNREKKTKISLHGQRIACMEKIHKDNSTKAYPIADYKQAIDDEKKMLKGVYEQGQNYHDSDSYPSPERIERLSSIQEGILTFEWQKTVYFFETLLEKMGLDKDIKIEIGGGAFASYSNGKMRLSIDFLKTDYASQVSAFIHELAHYQEHNNQGESMRFSHQEKGFFADCVREMTNKVTRTLMDMSKDQERMNNLDSLIIEKEIIPKYEKVLTDRNHNINKLIDFIENGAGLDSMDVYLKEISTGNRNMSEMKTELLELKDKNKDLLNSNEEIQAKIKKIETDLIESQENNKYLIIMLNTITLNNEVEAYLKKDRINDPKESKKLQRQFHEKLTEQGLALLNQEEQIKHIKELQNKIYTNKKDRKAFVSAYLKDYLGDDAFEKLKTDVLNSLAFD